MSFYFILCLWPKLSLETKNHLLWLRKTKQISQPLLLSTPATLSQQNRWRRIFERSFYTFQTTIDLILTQIQRWIWEKQLIQLKVQRLHHGNPFMKPSSTPSTSNTCNSFTAKSMMLNFWEKLLHLPNYNCSNFDTNPMVDLRETINQPKVQRRHHGNPSMKPSSTPSTSNTCNSLTAKSMTLNFWEELLHLPNYKRSNFDANPMVDLRETIN